MECYEGESKEAHCLKFKSFVNKRNGIENTSEQQEQKEEVHCHPRASIKETKEHYDV